MKCESLPSGKEIARETSCGGSKRIPTLLSLVIAGLPLAAAPLQAGDRFLPADDSRLSYSDYVRIEFIPAADAPERKRARFDRLAGPAAKGYQWDNPGTRLRFRTDAESVTVHLYYNEKHVSTSARNSVGRYLIDNRAEDAWAFATAQTGVLREPETVRVPIRTPAPGFHDYEIVLPYGDSVDVLGVSAPADARFEAPTPRPAHRLVAYGDSITHGFTASDVTKTYGYLLARAKNWQLINMGIGGRGSAAENGALIGQQKGDVVSVLIGANDWQGGRPPAVFRTNMDGFLDQLRKLQPDVPVFLITPLWVPPSWKPEKAMADLEMYRQALRDLVTERKDPNLLLIEGPSLIDQESRYFDRVAVHPNDAGFAQMAERLIRAVPWTGR
ncbi:MAG: GDSL-type esterase/lipase family protein [Kiritimatiellia bacterium]|nr:GDSL-type esterase/lipase family protein [Kiritimatiellia bacterium]